MKLAELRKRRKAAGYAAVCAVGSVGLGDALRFGAVEDVEILVQRLQLGTWHPLRIVWIRWVPGIEAARTVADRAERALEGAGGGLGQHWHRVAVADVDAAVSEAAAGLRCVLWTEEEMLADLRRQGAREVDRFMRDFG